MAMTLYAACGSGTPLTFHYGGGLPSLRLLRALALKRRLERCDEDGDVPLCVSLEGALVRSHVAHETLLCALRTRPWSLLRLLPEAIRRPAQARARLGVLARLDPAILPLRRDTLRYLRDQHRDGRSLALVGKADPVTMRALAEHLGLFAYNLAPETEKDMTPSGRARQLCAMFGPGGFDYLGSGSGDIPAWSTARHAVIVAPPRRILRHRTWDSQTAVILAAGRRSALVWLDALRPARWPRSLLVFAPLAAPGMMTGRNLVSLYCAFCASALVAMASELVCDMVHLPEDRRDRARRHRPLASGHMTADTALVLASFCAALGFLIAMVLSPVLVGWLAIYPVLALAYAFWFKRIAGLDVVALTALDLHRLVTGSVALGQAPFFWQLLFATPLLMCLAAGHRYAALARSDGGQAPVERAEYRLLPMLGMATGLISVILLALYAHQGDMVPVLGAPLLIWALCPVALCGVTLAWMEQGGALAGRLPSFVVRGIVMAGVLIFAAALVLGTIMP